MSEPILVIIANDQNSVANMWQRLINRQDDMDSPIAAYDGLKIVELAAEHKPDVIIMDVMMPGIDGIEATKQIIEQGNNTKIIVCSARPDIDAIAREAGAVQVLGLPLLPDILLNAIREVVKQLEVMQTVILIQEKYNLMIQVLIANDERAASSLLERVIDRSSDMTCIGCASNGEEAIRMAQALRPEVVLMDLMMPGIDGVEATKQIKATVPNTLIVVNTARSDYQDRAMEAGASVVLTIPISHEMILDTIRDVVASARNDYFSQ